MVDDGINLHWGRFWGWIGLGIAAGAMAVFANEALGRGAAVLAAGLMVCAIGCLLFYGMKTQGRDEFERDIASRSRVYAGMICVLLAAAAPVVDALGWSGFAGAYDPLSLPGLYIMFSVLMGQYLRWQVARTPEAGAAQ